MKTHKATLLGVTVCPTVNMSVVSALDQVPVYRCRKVEVDPLAWG